MAREFTPKVVTANHLLEGDVIYFTRQNLWSRSLHDAAVFHLEEQAEAGLALASKAVDEIAGAYLADVTVDDAGTIQPTHFREAFRMRGPSNYFHGKQAEV